MYDVNSDSQYASTHEKLNPPVRVSDNLSTTVWTTLGFGVGYQGELSTSQAYIDSSM